ncbi:MAG: DUF2784 domain-containing protein [Rhodospirillales bacterium]|nr:DUF2784 domain-containing protein [Rhodospirillales bacterium]
MNPALWADVVGLGHALIVLFVVGGEALILAGWACGWAWTRHALLRRAHLVSITIILVFAALDQWCPLTLWESELRARAGQAGYAEGFIATWLERLLYFEAPLWVFAIIYAAFALLVAGTYWKYPPDPR